MMDPKRLLEGDGSALECQLLAAARDDGPSAALENVMRAGLGLPVVSLPASALPEGNLQPTPSVPPNPSAPPPALAPVVSESASNALWLKAVGVAALVGVGASALWGVSRAGDSSAEMQSVAPRVAPPVSEPKGDPVTTQAAEGLGAAAVAGPGAAEPDEGAPGASEPAKPATSPRAARSSALEISSREARLREEIALIDDMRGALAKEDNALALSRYRSYVSRFPDGTLREEAEALRVEATRRSGDEKRADALAKRFESQHPESPHLGRVRGAASAATKVPAPQVAPK